MRNEIKLQRPLSLSFVCWLLVVGEAVVIAWKVLVYPLEVASFTGEMMELVSPCNIPKVVFHIGLILLHTTFLISVVAMLKRHNWGRVFLLALYPFSYVWVTLMLGGHAKWWPFYVFVYCVCVMSFFNPASNRYFIAKKKGTRAVSKIQKLKVTIVMVTTFITLLGTTYWILTEWIPKSAFGVGLFHKHIPSSKLKENLTSSDSDLIWLTLFILQQRHDSCGLDLAIPLLNNDNPHVWSHAAFYLGSFGRNEAVPYLINSLRAGKWNSRCSKYLQQITGQPFGEDFEPWKTWWEDQNPDIQFDWKTKLKGQEKGDRKGKGSGEGSVL